MRAVNNTKKIALSGLVSAISIVIMFFNYLFPYATLAIPAVAGGLLIILVIEINKQWATLSYISISILSGIFVSDKVSVLLFIMFFGCYPILKSLFENKKSALIEWVFKIAFLNISVILCIIIGFVFLGTKLFENQFNLPIAAFIIVGIIVLNIVFVIYDFALSRAIFFYVNRLSKQK